MPTSYIQGLNLLKVTPTVASTTYVVNPIDNQDNVFPQVIVEVDTTAQSTTIELPTINGWIAPPPVPSVVASLSGRLGFILKIVKTSADANTVTVTAPTGYQIGDGTAIVLGNQGSYSICVPINEIYWSAEISQ
jgi:hypothetical protein